MKLLQAAVLAAVLVPLGSVAVETAPITCQFGFEEFGGESCGESSPYSSTFTWGDYKFELEFLQVFESFFITIDDVQMSQGAFSERLGLEGAYQCVHLVDPADTSSPCIDFVITDSSDGTAWANYVFSIIWNYDSDPDFPNGTSEGLGQVRVLQNPSGDQSFDYTIDMCLAALTNEAYVECVYLTSVIDPLISSGNTDFSSFTVAWVPAQVPEPGVLILLGTGLTGLAYRRYRSRTRG